MSTTAASVRRYRIAEVSDLTGFTPATLRFYESAGVLAPPARTPSGYRTYDDRDIERLRLVARAKELGCTLDEIAGLVQAWENDECGPVKHRLRVLVDAKVADVQRHISEQMAFAAQLQATAAVLAGRPVDGPCDHTCGCEQPAAGPAPVAPESIPAGRAPIACSLGAAGTRARVEEWQALLVGVEERVAIANGVRLQFGPEAPLAEIARLAAAELDCCPFFAFALTVDGRGVALEVTAPDDGHGLLHAVFGAAA
jgi:DNA-binding transcriptional MerR regulator